VASTGDSYSDVDIGEFINADNEERLVDLGFDEFAGD
jgi:hypothetical protein